MIAKYGTGDEVQDAKQLLNDGDEGGTSLNKRKSSQSGNPAQTKRSIEMMRWSWAMPLASTTTYPVL